MHLSIQSTIVWSDKIQLHQPNHPNTKSHWPYHAKPQIPLNKHPQFPLTSVEQHQTQNHTGWAPIALTIGRNHPSLNSPSVAPHIYPNPSAKPSIFKSHHLKPHIHIPPLADTFQPSLHLTKPLLRVIWGTWSFPIILDLLFTFPIAY